MNEIIFSFKNITILLHLNYHNDMKYVKSKILDNNL